MIYRVFGKTGLRVSALSLGTEYLINIPREKAVSVIHRAIDMGINYFDLFWAQAEFRDNMGAAFSGHRDKVMLAAHLGSADIDGQYTRIRDQRRSKSFFIDFLRRYKTEYADVLFLHNNDTREDYARIMGSGGLLELAQRMRRKGKARFIGLSSHNAETSRIAVESGEIDVLMFALNLASHALPGRDALLRACEKNNIALVVMKPFAGGNLLEALPLRGRRGLAHGRSGGKILARRASSDADSAVARRKVVMQYRSIGRAGRFHPGPGNRDPGR